MSVLSCLLPILIATALPAEDPLPRRGALGLGFTPLPAEQAKTLGLKEGEGLVANAPVAGLTAEKLGVKAGDILIRVNGQPTTGKAVVAAVTGTRTGQEFSLQVVRDGKEQKLSGPLMERPRDPGNENYEVIYSHVTVDGKRMRTIITKPRKSGKYPAFFFIQGFSPVSYDFTLSTSKGDVTTLNGPMLHDIANSGFVTIRVEKPGVGDSEGGPFAQMDFKSEIGIYHETLKQLKAMPEVDTKNVFIFGHSMGGSFGPMVAAENPVRGLVVYGVAARTWFEYLVDIMRYQSLVSGASYAEADDAARHGARMMALIMLENKSPAEVKKSHPELATLVDGYFADGLFNGKTLEFWRQLNQINFSSYWAKLDADVLAVKGASDFVVYEVDHKLIADVVNRSHPGQGSWKICPDSDHLFHQFATEVESRKNFQRGTFNLNFSKMMKEWMFEHMAKS